MDVLNERKLREVGGFDSVIWGLFSNVVVILRLGSKFHESNYFRLILEMWNEAQGLMYIFSKHSKAAFKEFGDGLKYL